jgi:hypothetical protein
VKEKRMCVNLSTPIDKQKKGTKFMSKMSTELMAKAT